MKKIVTSVAPMLLALLVVEPSLTHAQTSPIVLGSTNGGELVEIDLAAGSVQLIGVAFLPGGWSDLAMDPAGKEAAARQILSLAPIRARTLR